MSEYIGNRWSLSLVNDWQQLVNFRNWNWIDFTLIEVAPEWDHRLGAVSLSLIVLGLGVRAGYIYDPATPFRLELKAMADDWLTGTHVSVPHDEYQQMKADAEKWRGVPVESLGRDA